ncbi:MAG: rRNA maturation RNase YbeY [Bacilli bacterium]|nr:rRNA maturation RNase YbeY [Bacilli bacterium]
MNKIEVFNETKESIDVDDIIAVLEMGCNEENLVDVSFNVIIVDNEYIHKINKEYRNIDKETDVITFALEDEDSVVLPGDERILGDIYISIDKVKSQAKEYGHSEKRELLFLVIHGFYHLLGYDHNTEEEERIMFDKQEKVLSEYGINR